MIRYERRYSLIKALKSRPLVFFCFTFVTLLYFSFLINQAQKLKIGISLIIATFLILFIGTAFKSKRFRTILVLIPITLGISSGLLFGYRFENTVLKESDSLIGKSGKVKGVIEEILYETDFSTAYKMRITEFDGKSVNIIALTKFSFGYQADEYNELNFDASFCAPSFTEDMAFNEKEYCRSKGMTVICNGEENVIKLTKNSSLLGRISSLSHSISAKLRLSLGEYNGGFVSGLILGRQEAVPDKLSTSFGYLGLSHILSVSGLHLTILVGALYLLMSSSPLPMWVRFIICTLFTAFFVLLTGAGPAVIRSAVMMTMTFAAYLIGRDYDPLSSLSLSALIIVIIDPLSVFSASFVLSLTASLGIIVLGIPACSQISKAIYERNTFIVALGGIGISAVITLSATLFTMPAVYYYFGYFSPISVFTNLLFVPLCTALMFISIILIIVYGTFLAPTVSVVANALASLIDRLSYAISQQIPEPLSLLYKFVPQLLIITFAFFVLLSALRRKGIIPILVMSAVFITGYFSGVYLYNSSNQIETEAICINHSSNDFILLNKNGSTLLCDISDGSTSIIYTINDLSLALFHDSCPDVLVLTHLHRKHITMISSFTDNFRPHTIYIPMSKNEDEQGYANAIKRIAEGKNVKLQFYSDNRDEIIDFEGCKINIYRQVKIDRSSQPINLIRIKDGASLVYCESSINDTELMDHVDNLILGESHLWLGTHGPVAKNPLKLPFEPYDVFVSNKNLNNVYCTDYEIISGYKHVILKKK